MTTPTCFYAYGSEPRHIAETIEAAIQDINQIGDTTIIGWKSLKPVGTIIIDEVCSAIDENELFICDLTTMNFNVLFELGYAIAKNKRIWITLDTSYGSAKGDYEKSILKPIGYVSYHNAFNLQNEFFRNNPHKSKEKTIFDRNIKSKIRLLREKPTIFYLKSEIHTHPSAKLQQTLENGRLDVTIDDPSENSHQFLSWYIENILSSHALVIHLIDDERQKNSSLQQNAKYSLIAGIAYGLNTPILILAQAPFKNPPIDYHELLFIHESASDCVRAVQSWLPDIEEQYKIKQDQKRTHLSNQRAAYELRRISIGDSIAENEKTDLLNYFIETNQYYEAMRSTNYKLFVGRKGSGKSANLYKIADELTSDKRNFVCVIKPTDYEFEGILSLLKLSLQQSEIGFLLESLWKFLIYTELTIGVFRYLSSLPSHYIMSIEEKEFYEYVDSNQELIGSDFTLRMEQAIKRLCGIDPVQSIAEQRRRVSEILHKELLGNLREQLGKVLHKKSKVCILIDNLDKSWKKRDDLNILSDFLYGLLSAGQAISDEFEKQGLHWEPVKLSLIVFLRSDIFSQVYSEARERDKLSSTTLNWDDAELLRRIIEERFGAALGEIPNKEIWEQYFTTHVKGIPTKSYIIETIIPRPRDIIIFCKEALSQAINHNHTQIEEDDLLQAEKLYSLQAFQSLIVETTVRFPEFESFLYEFTGKSEIVTHEIIRENIVNAKLDIAQLNIYLEVLLETTFLSVEIRQDEFVFLYDEPKTEVYLALARRVAASTGVQRFKINKAFQSFLEIQPSST